MITHPLAGDLDHIFQRTAPLWEALREQRIFITGGTGFFGCWLLESFVWANTHLNLNAKAVILTRNPRGFFERYPQLSQNPALQFHEGDIKNFNYPEGEFSHVIHAAADVNSTQSNSIALFDSIVSGTKRLLQFSAERRVRDILMISSGAVYGKQSVLSEDMVCQPDVLSTQSSYAIGKCAAEHLCVLFAKEFSLNVKIARCFSFSGPYLPVDTQFAIGCFIRDGLLERSIRVKGDGSAYRSYLHAADLAIWLWTILFKGQSLRPYNVGSEEPVSMLKLAESIAHSFSLNHKVQVMQQPDIGILPEKYVPSTQRAQQELGLRQWIHLQQIISATKDWFVSQLYYE